VTRLGRTIVAALFLACGAPAPAPMNEAALPPQPPMSIPALPVSSAPPPAPPRKIAKYEPLVAKLPSLAKPEIDRTFGELRKIADPRSADALAQFLAGSPHPRAKTLAALALAELGDERAIPTLVWRLGQDPSKLYTADDELLWSRDDNERVSTARLLSDLVLIHPDHRDEIGKQAEDAVLAWLASKPLPHSNGMRFLARIGSARGTKKIDAWAEPKDPLPAKGAQPPFPVAIEVAQSALRYVGVAHRGASDDRVRALLTKQLNRRPASVDGSMDAIMQGGMAVLGMALRAYSFGAADGFAELRDDKAVPTLAAFAEDPKNNENARIEACIAIGLIATAQQLTTIAAKIKSLDRADEKKKLTTTCWLEALARNPGVDLSSALAPLITASADPTLADFATKVLVLEGRANHGSMNDPHLLSSHFAVFYERDYADGHLARILRTLRADPAMWDAVKTAMSSIEGDGGPGTLTRVVARARVAKDAAEAKGPKRNDAQMILEAMGAEATLEALGFESP
jgi:HEAT repeat protein